jgi:uncharacterized membrane protein
MTPTAYTWTPVIVAHAALAGVAVMLGVGLITGLFTLLPGRLLGQWFWGWVLG